MSQTRGELSDRFHFLEMHHSCLNGFSGPHVVNKRVELRSIVKARHRKGNFYGMEVPSECFAIDSTTPHEATFEESFGRPCREVIDDSIILQKRANRFPDRLFHRGPK